MDLFSIGRGAAVSNPSPTWTVRLRYRWSNGLRKLW